MGRAILTPPPGAGDIVIRELTPSDRAAIAFSLAHLGERSRYQRWLGAGPGESREARRLGAADHWHHYALIAFSPVPRTPVGLAEYVRLEQFDVAELAISVNDGWQRRGVGRALARALRARALRAGIRRFTMTVARGNRGALALARELGECTVVGADGPAMELRVDL
jgi:RimJ/RimL family protein N-acetyltransferase